MTVFLFLFSWGPSIDDIDDIDDARLLGIRKGSHRPLTSGGDCVVYPIYNTHAGLLQCRVRAPAALLDV